MNFMSQLLQTHFHGTKPFTSSNYCATAKAVKRMHESEATGASTRNNCVVVGANTKHIYTWCCGQSDILVKICIYAITAHCHSSLMQ